ncbi:hypothetical protein F4777DRAFT_578915 [Nemania sp. FL0916]|nr:hypothetical protein F4777DRAFT_578915 [Nemania sp. FL0916]
MKNVQLRLLLLLLYATGLDAKSFKKNVPTYEISGAKVDGNKITYEEPDCDDGLDCTTTKTCSKAGYTPSLSEDKKYFACCAKGQKLQGSPDTAFDCCADGHDLAGSAKSGYRCCPTGCDFDGKACNQVCKNGKALVEGKCVCPKGTTEGEDGTCKKPETKPGECDDGECDSGLEAGKCYVFKADNGNRLGLAADNVYYAAPESMTQRYGKFQLCVDEKCTPGQPINPDDEVYIRDTYGDLATGANKNQWLIHAINGGHIGRTPLFPFAGHFSISKWPCGKYCLGGFSEGIGPACPMQMPALTFYSQDPQMCVEFEFTEVPCDLKSKENNCIWKSGDQCCNKVDCTKPHCSKSENASNSKVPVPTHPNASPYRDSKDPASSEKTSSENASLDDTSPESTFSEDPSSEAASSEPEFPDSATSDTTSPDDTPPDNASPDNASPDNASPDDKSPENASPDDASPDRASPENTSPDDASSDKASPDSDSPDSDSSDSGSSPEKATPKNTSNWSIPFPYITTALLATGSLAVYAMNSKLPKDKIAQAVAPLAPKVDIASALPEKDDIAEATKKTSEAVSRYTTAALSRFTTKSRTVVATSNINHDETSSSFTSSQVEFESSNSTPEELEM